MKKTASYAWRLAVIITSLIAVAGVAVIFATDSKVHGSVVARPLGWLAPLIVACTILAVCVVLMTQRRGGTQGNTSYDSSRCPVCEREVMGQWRMCPYCGAMLERSTA